MSKSLITLSGALFVTTIATSIPAYSQQDDQATPAQTPPAQKSSMPMKGMSGQMDQGGMQGQMMQQRSMMSSDAMQNCQAMQQQMMQLRKEMAELRAELKQRRSK